MINYSKRFNTNPYLPYTKIDFGDKSNSITGYGFIKNKDFTNTVKKVIEKYKTYNVDSLTLVRFLMPEVSALKRLVQKSRVGLDLLFHLSAHLHLTGPNGEKANLLYEKDKIVVLKEGAVIPKEKLMLETKEVEIPFDITLDDFIKIHVKYQKPRRYHNYDIFTDNCQIFLSQMLKSLSLSTPEFEEFVVINDTKILKQDLPNWAKGATDLANDIKLLWSRFRGEGHRLP